MKAFSVRQEAVRMDFERTFGVIVQSMQILARPCCLWDKAVEMNLVRACVMLHKMNREARRDDCNVDLHGRAVSGDSKSAYAGA